MAHQYLNRAQVGAGLEQVRRITVAQGVRVNLLVGSRYPFLVKSMTRLPRAAHPSPGIPDIDA